jgi:hypothetical protein
MRFIVTTMAVGAGIGAALGMALGIGFVGAMLTLACS